jgi:aryl-alcohol dehydrogenase-like predicted oxidoreductase
MTIGFEGMNGVRTSGEKDSQEILDAFFSYGHTEVDTARIYAEGTTEQVWCLICRPVSPPSANIITFITRSWPSST